MSAAFAGVAGAWVTVVPWGDHFAFFATDATGAVMTAGGDPQNGLMGPWAPMSDAFSGVAGAPVSVLPWGNHFALFAIDAGGVVSCAGGDPQNGLMGPWAPISDAFAGAPGAPVAVQPWGDHFALFATDATGAVMTAGGDPQNGLMGPWAPMSDAFSGVAGAPVSVLPWGNHFALFAIDAGGVVSCAGGDPQNGLMGPWAPISDAFAGAPGAPVAVQPWGDHFALFATDATGAVMTAGGDPQNGLMGPWAWVSEDFSGPPGAVVAAIPWAGAFAVCAVDSTGAVRTASGDPQNNLSDWTPALGLTAKPGSAATIVPIGTGVDLFAVDTTGAVFATGGSGGWQVVDAAITIPVDGLPIGGLALAPDGSRVYVGIDPDQQGQPSFVSVIDTSTNTVVGTMGPLSWIYGLAVAPDGRRLYVVHGYSLSVFDTASNEIIQELKLGVVGPAIAVAPDGRRVYITLRPPDTAALVVQAVDTASYTVAATTTIGQGPERMAVIPDGSRLYVTHDDGTLYAIDTASSLVIAEIVFDGASQRGLAIAPDGARAYVTAASSTESVVMIDTASNQVIRSTSIPVEAEGVAVTRDGGFLFVTGWDRVWVVDTPSGSVLPTTIQAGQEPSDPALTDRNLYVANVNSKTVSVIGIDGLNPYGPTPAGVVDRSAEYAAGYGTQPAAGAPTACVVTTLGVYSIAYRHTSGQLFELSRDLLGSTGVENLTAIAGAPTAVGNPFFYVDTSRSTVILLYRGGEGVVQSLYWSTPQVGHDDLSGTAGAPTAAGDPVGYYVPGADTHHVVYRAGDGHLHELDWVGVDPVVYGGNLTGTISAPKPAGEPSAFADAAGVNIVVYRSEAGQILSVYWSEGPSGLDELSAVAGTPTAAGDPVGYYTAHDDTHQIVYLGSDGHLWELYWQGGAPVVGWDLTTPSGAPAPAGTPAAYYSAGTNTKHVIYRSADGTLHDISWVPGGGTPAHVNLTAAYGAPAAADAPAAFTVEGPNTQHVAYRATDNHIYEIRW